MWYSKQYCLSAVDPVPENVVHCYHRKCTQILTCAHAQNSAPWHGGGVKSTVGIVVLWVPLKYFSDLINRQPRHVNNQTPTIPFRHGDCNLRPLVWRLL